MSALSGLDPRLRPWAEELLRYLGQHVRVTSVYRSYDEQLELWRNRHRNPYPVAPPGRSYHGYRRAWDMVGDPAVLAWAGSVWRSWGGTWNPSDAIHFQG